MYIFLVIFQALLDKFRSSRNNSRNSSFEEDPEYEIERKPMVIIKSHVAVKWDSIGNNRNNVLFGNRSRYPKDAIQAK